MDNLSLADKVAEESASRVPARGCAFFVKLAGRVEDVLAWGAKPEESFLRFKLADGSVVYIDLTVSELMKLHAAIDMLEEEYSPGYHSPGYLHYVLQGTRPFDV